ncbi:MAG: glycosyltransferase family 4 protein [Hyphomicrobiaceae bacterium]
MKILVLIANPCTNDARVIREAEALAEAGHDVVVYAAWRPGLPAEETRGGVVYRRRPTRALDAVQKLNADKTPQPANPENHPPARRWGLIDLYMATRGATRWLRPLVRETITSTTIELLRNAYYFRIAATEQPDVIHAHELATMLAGSRIARQTGAKLVYDSHELETGRNGIWGTWELWLRGQAERWLIRRADRVITVSDSIAEHMAKLYAIEAPTVILNAPAIEPKSTITTSRSLRAQLGLHADASLAVYVGSLTRNRGLEQCVQSLCHAPEVHIAAVGPREPDIEAKLKTMAAELGVIERFHLVDAVPHGEVTSFIGSAGVSLILIQDVCLSYRYCFPNKLLESLLAGIPVVAARLVELRRMIERTGAGIVVDETDPRSIAQGIRAVLAERSRFAPSAETIRDIAETYGWQVQRRRLIELYDGLAK